MQVRAGVQVAVARRLVPRHQVRHRALPETVELEEHGLQRAREVGAFVVGEVGELRRGADRRDPALVRIARADRNERDRVLAFVQHANAVVALVRDHRFERTDPVGGDMLARQRIHAGRNGWHDGVGVDLAVRMMQRRADLDAAVLERKDIAHVVARAEPARAVAPDLDQELDVAERERAERRRPLGCVDDDLAVAAGGRGRDVQLGHLDRALAAERGEAVVEHRDFPVAPGKLGRTLAIGRRRERVVLGRRLERPVLAVRRVRHPFAAQRMPTQMRLARERLGERARRIGDRRERRARIERQRAAVGLGQLERMHRAAVRPRPGCRCATRSSPSRSARAGSSACGRRAAGRSLPGRCR